MTDEKAMVKVDNIPISRRQKTRRWILKLALGLAILTPLLFMIAGLGYRAGLWGLGFGLGTLTQKIGPVLALLTLGLGFVSLLLALLMKPRRGITLSVVAVLIPLAALIHLNGVKSKVDKLPFIHDVTTDTQNPPTFTEAITSKRAHVKEVNTLDYIGKKDTRDKTLVSVLQTRAYPDIRSLILEDEPDVVFGEAKAAVQQMGWKIVSENVGAGVIEATDTTFWYGFKDDVVIRVRPSEGGGSVLDVRSVSRVGGSDMGANAERIRAYLKLIGS